MAEKQGCLFRHLICIHMGQSFVMFYAFLALWGALLFERRSDYGRGLSVHIAILQKVLLELGAGSLKIEPEHGSQGSKRGVGDGRSSGIIATINDQLALGQSVTERLARMLEWQRRFLKLHRERRRLWLLILGRFLAAAFAIAIVRIAKQPLAMALWGAPDEHLLVVLGGGISLGALMLFIKLLPVQRLLAPVLPASDFWRSLLSLEPHGAPGEVSAMLTQLSQREWQQGVALSHEKLRYLEELAADHLGRERQAIDRCQDLLPLFELCAVGPFVVLLLFAPVLGING